MPRQLLSLILCVIILSSCLNRQSSDIVKPNSSADTAENANFSKAYDYLDEGKMDSSFIYFELASNEFLERGDSLNVAICFIQMAVTLNDEGDFLGSQETSLDADRLLDTSNKEHYSLLSINYNNLGNAISGYGDQEEAIAYYDLAIKYATDSLNANIYENNKAVTLFYVKKYKEAFAIHKNNLESIQKSDADYARVLSNYANTRWRIDKRYNPLVDFHKALAIRLHAKDNFGLNSSYSHLFEYHYDKNHIDSAKYYALKCYAIANKIQISKDQINAVAKLIKISSSDSSKYYFQRYKELSDSLNTSRLKARNQYALIRYKAEKNVSQNLKLQKEVLDKDLRMTRERVLWVGLIGLALSALIFYVFWTQRRKQRMKLEAENKVKEIQLSTSKKVHDVVANGIYRVMAELEYKEDYDKEALLDKLEAMYEKSRDISYERSNDIVDSSFTADVFTLLNSFSSKRVKLVIVGNDAQLWDHISKGIKNELLIVFQELLVNMKKHSKASEVIFRFEKINNVLTIFYMDNGIGIANTDLAGNGFQNTGNRIERLGGRIKFVSEKGNGLKIDIYIPLP